MSAGYHDEFKHRLATQGFIPAPRTMPPSIYSKPSSDYFRVKNMPKIGGFQSFTTRRTIAGFEAILRLRKGRFFLVEGRQPSKRSASALFGLQEINMA